MTNLKSIAKKAVKSIIPKHIQYVRQGYHEMLNFYCIKDVVYHGKVYFDKTPGTLESVFLMKRMLRKVKPVFSNGYVYPYDPLSLRVIPKQYTRVVSITPDYSKIIKSSLSNVVKQLQDSTEGTIFKEIEKNVVSAIWDFAKGLSRFKDMYPQYAERLASLPVLLERDCMTLDEAIQKLLFYNGLLWQYGHRHNGLGRLDMILYPYYRKDKESGIGTYDSAKRRIKDMCRMLGSQTKVKSGYLTGDTGQYILLGGTDAEGNTVDNELTRMFLEIFTELHIPDPKLILRVNISTSDEIWNKAIQCLSTGCGSPLIMNETPIMKKMSEFGYKESDVWNVGTSACWEPLIIGKSADQNNPFRSIVACKALDAVLRQRKQYRTFDSLLDEVELRLKDEVEKVVIDFNLDHSPILTLFSDNSLLSGRDYFHGGSEYMYHGAQVVSLPNLVNSLMNLKDYVYDKALFSIEDCIKAIEDDYAGHEDMRQLFKSSNKHRFGSTDHDVEVMTDRLISCVSRSISTTESNGHKVKFGLSSPNYIIQAKEFPATLDGRKAGEPFAVHISPVSSDIDINEVLHFASDIAYPVNCINGNVTDFIIPPAYMKEKEKLASILKSACRSGVMQIQLNVLDKETLKDAKAHPEKYPTLIVRVWGFSAYFNDLPEEYQDYLIKRAETYGATA